MDPIPEKFFTLEKRNEFLLAFLNLSEYRKVAFLRDIIKYIEYPDKTIIVSEDTPIDKLYVITKGSVMLTKLRKTINEIGEKDNFGQEFLITDKSVFSAVAKGTVQCIELTKIEVNYIFSQFHVYPLLFQSNKIDDENIEKFDKSKSPANELNFLKKVLKKLQVVKLTETEQEKFMLIFEQVKYKAGDVLVPENATTNQFFILRKGEINISKNYQGLSVVDLPKYSKGILINEMALIQSFKSPVTIKLETDSVVWKTSNSKFKNFLRGPPKDDQEFLLFLDEIGVKKKLNLAYLNAMMCHVEIKASINLTELDRKFLVFVFESKKIIHKKFEFEFLRGTIFKYNRRKLTFFPNPLALKCAMIPWDEIKHAKESIISKIKISKLGFPEQKGTASTEKAIPLKNLVTSSAFFSGQFLDEKLVKNTANEQNYVFRRIGKAKVAKEKLKRHVLNEKAILSVLDNPFVEKLVETYNFKNYLCFLTQQHTGKSMADILEQNMRLSEITARFYVACIVEAIIYLHSQKIVYRNFSMKNLKIDNKGYLVLTNFQISRSLQTCTKTYTLCGSPNYIAPEVILGAGYDEMSDYWGLGLIVYQILVGRMPFPESNLFMKYRMIVGGIYKCPIFLSDEAKSLIGGLLNVNPKDRLGKNPKDIKNHAWFKDFDWNGVLTKTIKSPIDIDDMSDGSVNTDEKIVEYEECKDRWSKYF